MFITNTEPLITLTLNGIPASLSRGIGEKVSGKAHLEVSGTRRGPQSGKHYHPLSPEGLPTEDDESEFAQLYWLLQILVDHGLLKGPYGENHPAVYYYFKYPSTELTIEQLLDELTGLSIAVSNVKVNYARGDEPSAALRVEYGKGLETKASMMTEACEVLGKYMKPDTEIIYPEIIENPKPMTPEEQAALLDDARESFGEKVLFVLSCLFGILIGWWAGPLLELYWRFRYGPLK